MAFTTPRDWTDEELIDATIMNAHVRDNLRYLKGLDGVPTIESGLIIDNTGGDEYLLLPSLTTAERNALTAVNGMIVYNETTTALNAYENGAWGAAGVKDHGALLGLGDDDHTIYLLADGTRNLTGNLTVSASVTIDGIDISAHDIATTAVHGAGAYTLLHTGDVDDAPVDAATTAPVSSNWAFDQGAVTKEPTGFPNITDTSTPTLSTATVTLAKTGTSFDFYIKGVKYTKTVNQTVSLPNGDATDTGTWYIAFNEAGTLTATKTTSWDIAAADSCPVAVLYFNGTAGEICDERHGTVMSAATHDLLHYTVGTRYQSGLTGTFTDPANIEVALGIIHDEDLEYAIDAQTQCIPFYHASGVYTFAVAQNAYVVEVEGVLQYDNLTDLIDVTNNQYVAYWVFATMDTVTPIWVMPGQREDNLLQNARDLNKYESLVLGTLPFPEMKLLYRVIVKRSGTDEVYVETQDLRTVSNLPSGTYVATDHAALTGLLDDDHTQYLLVAGSRALSGAWDMGSQNLTNVNIDSGTMAGVTLDGTITGGSQVINSLGHIGIGTTSHANYGVGYQETVIDTADADWIGVRSKITAYKTSAAYYGAVFGVYGQAVISASNTQNWESDPIGLSGVVGSIALTSGTAATKTVTGAASLYASMGMGSAANDMVLTNYYGLYIAPRTLIGNSKLTNDYGIWIGNQAGGATLNYSIYTGTGLVHFGDSVIVVDDALLSVGTNADGVILNCSAGLSADTALAGVLIGTPDTTALAANSMIIANATADGDILLAYNDGGTSRQALYVDGSTGLLHLGKPGTPVGTIAGAGDVYIAGDVEISGRIDNSVYTCYSTSFICGGIGSAPVRFLSCTTDASAKDATFTVTTSAEYVPIFSFGDNTIVSLDKGLFDTETQPAIAVFEKDAKYATVTDATSSGADTTITVDGAEFTAAVAGDEIRVTGGTNATVGRYIVITVTDNNNVVVDRNWCTGIVSNGAFVAYHHVGIYGAQGFNLPVKPAADFSSSDFELVGQGVFMGWRLDTHRIQVVEPDGTMRDPIAIHAADVDAHGEVVVTTEDSNTATSADLALTMAAGEGINTTSTGSTVTITGEAASTTNIGVVELATGGETNTGTSATLAVTPDGLDDWTGSAQIATVGTLSSGDVTAQVSAASDSAAGKVELALYGEVNTGTSTSLAITPDALAGSIHGEKIVYIKVIANDTALTTADDQAFFTVPDSFNGMNLVDADIAVYTTSSATDPSVQLSNHDYAGGAQDMLSTTMTIDAGGTELSSYTASTPPVINGTYDDVATGDRISVDVKAHGTGTKGLDVILTFQTP